MLGKSIASVAPLRRRWFLRLWGYPDIHTRQKWLALWPYLEELSDKGVRLLDAGCGMGRWALEIATRCPSWTVVGLDKDGKALQGAEHARQSLKLSNVTFFEPDFLDFWPDEKFDIILSVGSAHYCVENGDGDKLFQNFSSWLKPNGQLLLLGPRSKGEVDWYSFLPPPNLHEVFSATLIRSLCKRQQLQVETLKPYIGRMGILAKQIAIGTAKSRLMALIFYPLELFLNWFDCREKLGEHQKSLYWVLIARKGQS